MLRLPKISGSSIDYLYACVIYKVRMYLVPFRVMFKILVLLQPLFVALFLLFNIVSEIIIDYSKGLILPPGANRPPPPLATPLVYIYISHKKDRPP